MLCNVRLHSIWLSDVNLRLVLWNCHCSSHIRSAKWRIICVCWNVLLWSCICARRNRKWPSNTLPTHCEVINTYVYTPLPLSVSVFHCYWFVKNSSYLINSVCVCVCFIYNITNGNNYERRPVRSRMKIQWKLILSVVLRWVCFPALFWPLFSCCFQMDVRLLLISVLLGLSRAQIGKNFRFWQFQMYSGIQKSSENASFVHFESTYQPNMFCNCSGATLHDQHGEWGKKGTVIFAQYQQLLVRSSGQNNHKMELK